MKQEQVNKLKHEQLVGRLAEVKRKRKELSGDREEIDYLLPLQESICWKPLSSLLKDCFHILEVADLMKLHKIEIH